MKFDLNIDDIKYIKILYTNADGHPVTTKAAIKSINDKEITACIKFDDYFQIDTPQDITISFICTEGLYRTKTKLISYSKMFPYIMFYLEAPQNLEYKQNREYFRVPVSFKCKYNVLNNGQPAVFNADTADISANGISIIMPVHIFSEKDAEIEIFTDEKTITAKIRYIRSERLSNDSYKMSFTYTKISERDRDYIAQICILKQLEFKRTKIDA